VLELIAAVAILVIALVQGEQGVQDLPVMGVQEALVLEVDQDPVVLYTLIRVYLLVVVVPDQMAQMGVLAIALGVAVVDRA
jgi:hypothetical protein